MSYGDSDLFDISDVVLQSYQLSVHYLLVRYLLVIIRCSCSEFIWVVSDTFVLVISDHVFQ